MKPFYEYGLCKLEIKGLDIKKREVEIYFASFDTLDSDGDVFQKGAFTKSIKEWGPGSANPRIKHLYNHWDAAGVLKDMFEDEKGLRAVSVLGRHTIGKDTLLMYDDGIITEHSVGFETQADKKETDHRIITQAWLWEGSSLDKWGANMNTPVVKSMEQKDYFIDKLAKLSKALYKGNYSDETLEVFEIQVKQIQQILAGLDSFAGSDSTPQGAADDQGGQDLKSKSDALSGLKNIIK